MRARFVNEKFVENSDPVSDMGIGIRGQISRWMKEINEEDTDISALAECAAHGKLEWVKFLIDKGIDVNIWNYYILDSICRNGHLEILRELIKAGIDIDRRYYNRFMTLANNHNHYEIVKELRDYIAKEKKTKDNVVRESLNEKFVEDSDPVTDMGIGMSTVICNELNNFATEPHVGSVRMFNKYYSSTSLSFLECWYYEAWTTQSLERFKTALFKHLDESFFKTIEVENSTSMRMIIRVIIKPEYVEMFKKGYTLYCDELNRK